MRAVLKSVLQVPEPGEAVQTALAVFTSLIAVVSDVELVLIAVDELDNAPAVVVTAPVIVETVAASLYSSVAPIAPQAFA